MSHIEWLAEGLPILVCGIECGHGTLWIDDRIECWSCGKQQTDPVSIQAIADYYQEHHGHHQENRRSSN